MYLKSIEVQGFKSFANKIVFEFHNGITGIVGPNGSGKSNVADAVRWVLGEQRVKQLRGGSMQDVIFSGTENRKPLSYAYVAITLDNSDHQLAIDYEEVTVARKLYRSGESEYLINGNACRLKDVNELFYDTGIGKEGYSIIGQGQIERILSGKPEERRELFDEAAGIVKFKRRKSLSLKKLEDESQNLLRVNDILAELEKQKGPLERQSEVARVYLKKKEELKTYDINLFLLETERLKEQLRDTEEKLRIVREELERATADYENMKAEYDAVEGQMDTIDASVENYKNRLNETTLLKQQLENQIALLQEQIHSARMTDEHYAQRAGAIADELAGREEELVRLSAEENRLAAELADRQREEETAGSALIGIQSRIAELGAEAEGYKNDIIDLLNNRASTRAKVQRYDSMLEHARLRSSELQGRLISSRGEAEAERKNLEDYQETLRQLEKEIEALCGQSSAQESRISGIQKQMEQKTKEIRETQNRYHREGSRLESLKNMTERYEGYGNSIRRVMELRGKEKGLLGVVADIIKAEKQYEVAIETALGGSIQNIVTDNEETAKRMIAYLKKNRYGRATFLPLTSAGAWRANPRPEALREPGVIGTADTLVRVEDRYKGLAANLLGRTIVVDQIDHGIAIARKYHQSLRLVTLEGDLLNPGGSMSGGAYRNSSNLLSRRREIGELEKSVAGQKQRLDALEQETEALRRERTGCYERIDRIRQQLQEIYVKQNTAKLGAGQAGQRIGEVLEEEQKARSESETLERQIAEIRENQDSIALELETSERLEKELSGKAQEAQEAMEQLKEQETTAQKQAETIHLDCAGLEQKLFFARENTERIRQELEKYRQEQRKLESGKDSASREIQEKERQIEEIRQTIGDSGELFAEIQAEIEKATREREELGRQHKSFLKKREDLSVRMADLDKESFRLESRKESLEEASDKQIDYMWQEYELTYNRALELRSRNLTDLAAMKKQIQTLKNEIRALGSVNVNAIEDYKNLSERYEFLKGQHDDLEEAKASLIRIIDELDAAMRAQFTEQFARIAEEFNLVFRELFGGGKGTLELMEDEDVLEAGIRIIAQPPGKKLQNMMQLSGGEKALTAISLLFAIQNLKPSPFCLLDEIEAALDDSNVTRFARYLHKLTEHTQFIVITHRRGTMTAADRLYGITMQEKGVSALVSVSLLEDELDQ